MNLFSSNALVVTLDSAQSVDIVASYSDGGGDFAGNNIHVTSTTTTVVVPAPGTGQRRRLTDLNIRALITNTTPVTPYLKVGDPSGSDFYHVMSGLLKPGDVLTYDHQRGWSVVAQALLGNALADIYTQLNPQLMI